MSPVGGLRFRQLREIAALEEEQLCEPRARGVRLGVADRDGIAIESADAPGRQEIGLAARLRSGAKRLPGGRVVLFPALEAEPLAEEPRRDVGGDQGRLDRKRPRAAHRVDERAACRRDRGPAGAHENGGGEIFLERRRALPAAIAAPVQALAREVDRDRERPARGVGIDAKRRRVAVHGRSRAGLLAELVDDRVLHALRAELRVRDARHAAGEIDGERRVDVEVRAPVDAAHARVERIRIRHRESRELPQHAKAQARFEAGAIGGREIALAGDAAQHLARALDAERDELRREQVGRAGCGRHEEWRANHRRARLQELGAALRPVEEPGQDAVDVRIERLIGVAPAVEDEHLLDAAPVALADADRPGERPVAALEARKREPHAHGMQRRRFLARRRRRGIGRAGSRRRIPRAFSSPSHFAQSSCSRTSPSSARSASPRRRNMP